MRKATGAEVLDSDSPGLRVNTTVVIYASAVLDRARPLSLTNGTNTISAPFAWFPHGCSGNHDDDLTGPACGSAVVWPASAVVPDTVHVRRVGTQGVK